MRLWSVDPLEVLSTHLLLGRPIIELIFAKYVEMSSFGIPPCRGIQRSVANVTIAANAASSYVLLAHMLKEPAQSMASSSLCAFVSHASWVGLAVLTPTDRAMNFRVLIENVR